MANWSLTLNLSEFWHNEDLGYFSSLVDELAETLNVAEFDLAFGDLYDQADADRVLIETH